MNLRTGAFGIATALAVAAPVLAHGPQEGPVRAPAPSGMGFSAPALGSYELPALGDAADAAVIDTESGSTRLHDLYDGKIVLLSFIYTNCADAKGCPLSMAVMRQVGARFEGSSDVRLLTLSFDPARDTPEVMREFGQRIRNVDADWHFLTTSSTQQARPVLEAYDQSVQVEYDERGEPTGQLAHILRVYLIDGEKRIRNIYSSAFLYADVLVNDARSLLLESGQIAAVGTSPPVPADLSARVRRPPLGLPLVDVPEDNPVTKAKIDLGRIPVDGSRNIQR